MIEFNFTDEELDALKYYKERNYEAINQMLVSDAETDIALLSSEVENKVVSIAYDRIAIIEYLKNIKLVYSLMLKSYYEKKCKAPKSLYRGTNLSEIERIKNELFIDRMLSATENENEAINVYSSIWNRPACMNITLDSNIPFINLRNILKEKKYKNEIIISPFTKIKFISEDEEKKIDKNSKTTKVYNVELEKQYLDELSENERNGLYQYILENAYYIKKKLVECIEFEQENVTNFENVRKLEQLLRKYEIEIEEKEISNEYSDSEIDYDDINRITNELNELKKISTSIFEVRKENINFINMWKRNIAVYMIAECREIEKSFEAKTGISLFEIKENTANDEIDTSIEKIYKEENEIIEENDNNNVQEKSEENLQEDEIENSESQIEENLETDKREEYKEDNVENIVSNEIIEEMKLEDKNKNDFEETKIVNVVNYSENEFDSELQKRVKTECKENIEAGKKLLNDIKDLISKQQNHAKIAGNLGAVYSALNNGFEMKKVAETLLKLLENISLKVDVICEEDGENEVKLEEISKKNIQINTLINYLNNPKIVIQNSKVTRFDEMTIIEENELKRGIAERIRLIRSEAELKKLKDDLEIIEDKGSLSRFFGFFTGKNKLDEIMIEQIEIRQSAIRRTMSNKLSLAYNYSIHELVAEIEMFVKENEDDYLVNNDVSDLKAMSDELRKNFIIIESKVQSIVEKKEGKNLLLDNKKMTKSEIIEIETYRFLNKYGYDLVTKTSKEEPKYQDTMANEIARIIEYVNSSKIL